MLTVDASRKDIVDYYSQFDEVSAYLIRVDAKEHNTSVPIIKATSKLIQELQFHKPVILADADIVVFGYLSHGLSALSTSFADSKREHDLAAKYVDKKDGGNYKEKFFVPKIFQFVKVDGELAALVGLLGPNGLCSCSVCSAAKVTGEALKKEDINKLISRWSKDDRSNHFLCCLVEWRDKMAKISTPSAKLEEYKKILVEAENIYDSQKENLVFEQMIKQKDYPAWEAAFFSK
ncbi:MAG: hypothetical protein G01um10147_1055 [Microgenomates group bacterium Gr01-1014_7]|nr:MAG: hypothetical protein G01um10147_1055 [Microgenomates group bacterium Gr01-1014_7]